MYNKDGYSLISPTYFPFGSALIRTIRIVVNPGLFDKERNELYQFCKESLENNLNLRNMFLNILDKDSLSVEVNTTVYNLLLTETCRARYNFERKPYIKKNSVGLPLVCQRLLLTKSGISNSS